MRNKQGLTQSELAERCNVSLRTIQRIESGETSPRSHTAKIIFETLGYDFKDDGDWIDRALVFIKDLFNLKTNTMKKVSVLTIFAAMLFAGIFFTSQSLNAQRRERKATTASLTGVWQQVYVNPETNEVTHYLPILKIFHSDGTYTHMSEASGADFAFLNATGKWKVVSANRFLEYVEIMYGQNSRRTEDQTFTIEKRPDGTFIRSKYHNKGSKESDTYEVWRKCNFGTREKAAKKWSRE